MSPYITLVLHLGYGAVLAAVFARLIQPVNIGFYHGVFKESFE